MQSEEEAGELPDAIHARIVQLSEEGDRLASQGSFERALAKYQAALGLLPTPSTDWEAATWLFAAIGDVHFKGRDFASGIDAFERAVQCPGGLGNPFIHLRRGQCLFETRDREGAMDELARAYMGAGKNIFSDEEPKYFEALSGVLKPPAGSSSL